MTAFAGVILGIHILIAAAFAWASWYLAHGPEPQGRVTSDRDRS